MRKNVKGITLVALVITIIILLILAGITISQLSGSGLFENAKLAEQKSKEAQEKEDGILGDYENKIESLGNISSSRTEPSSGYSATKLWEFDSTATDVNNGIQTGIITLSDSIQNYDEIVVTGNNSDENQAVSLRVLKVNYYMNANTEGWDHLINMTTNSTLRRIIFSFSNDNQVIIGSMSGARLVNIYGIKY